jgi:serine/threonine protein kinase, bacterial
MPISRGVRADAAETQSDPRLGEKSQVGQPIGSRYELEEQLGRGAFGSVWRGRVRQTGEAVAVKVLLEELAADADVVTRFLRERTALVGLRHRSLVSVRDLVVEGDVLALVMQLVEGPDLRQYLRGRGTLGSEEAALLVADVADALAVAHAAQIIHRDVKPANVLLQPESGGFRPLLTDFGIARLADAPSVTRTSQVVGTPYYLAPEVISGAKATPAVDVYASGVMFYELITGHPPFRGADAMEVFRAHQMVQPQRPAGVPDRIWAVALSALAKNPTERPNASELSTRLRSALRSGQGGGAARLPVNPTDGTAHLPALPAGLEIGPDAPKGNSPRSDGQRAAAVGAAGAAVGIGAAAIGSTPGSAPGSVLGGRQAPALPPGSPASPQIAPAQPTVPSMLPAAQAQQRSADQRSSDPRAVQAAAQAPTTPIRTATPPVAPQRPATPSKPRPATSYPPAPQNYPTVPAPASPYAQPHASSTPQNQHASRSAPPNQVRVGHQPQPQPQAPLQPPPRQQQYARPNTYPPQPAYPPAPRKQAPRYPQTYAGTTPAPRAGLSCLSKLALLVVILAVAVLIGVMVGRYIQSHEHVKFNTRNSTVQFGASAALVVVPAAKILSAE